MYSNLSLYMNLIALLSSFSLTFMVLLALLEIEMSWQMTALAIKMLDADLYTLIQLHISSKAASRLADRSSIAPPAPKLCRADFLPNAQLIAVKTRAICLCTLRDKPTWRKAAAR